MTKLDPNLGKRTVIDQIGPKNRKTLTVSVDYGPFYYFRDRFGPLQSILSDLGPICSIPVRFTSFGSDSVDYGPFYQIWVQFGQLWSVLLIQGVFSVRKKLFIPFSLSFQAGNFSSSSRSKIQKLFYDLSRTILILAKSPPKFSAKNLFYFNFSSSCNVWLSRMAVKSRTTDR